MIEGMLNYNIKGTGLEINDELRSYTEKRLEQAEKFLQGDSAAHADVELEFAPVRDGHHYRAEFTITSSGGLYRASDWGETMHGAIDLAIEQIASELRRGKQKRLDIVRRSAARAKDFLRGLRG